MLCKHTALLSCADSPAADHGTQCSTSPVPKDDDYKGAIIHGEALACAGRDSEADTAESLKWQQQSDSQHSHSSCLQRCPACPCITGLLSSTGTSGRSSSPKETDIKAQSYGNYPTLWAGAKPRPPTDFSPAVLCFHHVGEEDLGEAFAELRTAPPTPCSQECPGRRNHCR